MDSSRVTIHTNYGTRKPPRRRERMMKLCPWCEGKGIVGQLAHGEEPDTVTVLSVAIPVIGTMLDVACKACDGTCWVPDDFDLNRRIEALQAAKAKGEK